MPKVSKATASSVANVGPMESHSEQLGDFFVEFSTFHEGGDLTPLFAGLPDDRCQAPHWGYVVSGRLTFKFADRDETYEAGDAYYAPPGHTPVLFAGTEIVEFSPSEELDRTFEVVTRTMEAA